MYGTYENFNLIHSINPYNKLLILTYISNAIKIVFEFQASNQFIFKRVFRKTTFHIL